MIDAVLPRLPWRWLGAAAAVLFVWVLADHRGYARAEGHAAANALQLLRKQVLAMEAVELKHASKVEDARQASAALATERDQALADLEAERAKPLEVQVVYRQTPRGPERCLAARGLLQRYASGYRTIAGTLRPAERGPYVEAAALADARAEAGGCLTDAELLNHNELLLSEATASIIKRHGLQDYVRTLQAAGVVRR